MFEPSPLAGNKIQPIKFDSRIFFHGKTCLREGYCGRRLDMGKRDGGDVMNSLMLTGKIYRINKDISSGAPNRPFRRISVGRPIIAYDFRIKESDSPTLHCAPCCCLRARRTTKTIVTLMTLLSKTAIARI